MTHTNNESLCPHTRAQAHAQTDTHTHTHTHTIVYSRASNY